MDASNEVPESDMTQLIGHKLADYQRLCMLLDTERSLLVNRDIDNLAQTLNEKQALLGRLDQMSQLLVAVLNQQDLTGDEPGIQQLFGKLPQEEKLKTSENWTVLKELVKTCNHKNEVNARIANRAQQTSRQILNILRGTGNANLYDKAGKGRDSDSGGTITSA